MSLITNFSLVAALRTSVHDLVKHRWLIWVKFRSDFVAPYRTSSLGALWSIINPVIPISVYVVLALFGVFPQKGEIPKALFIVSGFTIWALIPSFVLATIDAVWEDRSALKVVNIPILVIIASRLGQPISETLVRVVVLMGVLAYYNVSFGIQMVVWPILLVPILLFSIGFGLIASMFNLLSNDVRHALAMILTYGVWASSVIIPMPTTGYVGYLAQINLFNQFVVGARSYLVVGALPNPTGYLVASVVSVFVFLLGIWAQHQARQMIRNFL